MARASGFCFMYNVSVSPFRLSPFIHRFWGQNDTEKAGAGGWKTGRERPGVSSYNRFFLLLSPLGYDDAIINMFFFNWSHVQL